MLSLGTIGFRGTPRLAHGLNLGRIPFPATHTPYTSPEKRRRKRQREAGRHEGALFAPVDAAALAAVEAEQGKTDGSASARVSIRPVTAGPRDVQFLLGSSEERMGRSVVASFASHLVGVAFLAILMSLTPEPIYEIIQPSRQQYNMIWIPEEGPGGGGGGGGNESLELPTQVEVEGQDEVEVSVPIPEEPDYVEPDVEEPEPLDTQMIDIPAVPMATALETRTGVLEGLMAASTLSQGSGSGGGAGTGQGTGTGPGQGSGLGSGSGGGVGGGVYRPGAGIINPQPVREVKPRYTAEAMRAKVQGAVWLEAVVQPDGTVGDVRVTKSLDAVFGLDEEAIRAAKQWRFRPGTRFGEPVAVLVVLELTFTLR